MTKQNNTTTSLSARIIFWGTPEFAVPSLDTLNKLDLVSLVVTQPDRPAGRGKKLLASPIKEYATENNIDILEPQNLDDHFINELKKYLPATFVVVAYGKIIPQEILDLSELKAINIHPSMLPILRGPSPSQSALLKGFQSTGVSLMQLDKKMDHGPILSQIEVKIEPNEDYIDLSERLSKIGADIINKHILDYLNNKITPLPQDDEQASFCKMIKKEDGLIDWQKSAQDIHNKVRAFRLWPGAYTKLDNLDIKILKSEVVEENLKPGEIKFDKNNLIVGTADQSLKILELQVAGKKAMSVQDFIRGYNRYLDKTFQ
ncbi:MAG: methionyl-tRNA formyltransferase [Candidatus Komeilibacteria bacterium]|jgi:methionyl-tRNA formyltransferase|nr:methionyl-tRNA formyltransferase [Candidatus Komeilibacteria bacterium]